MSQDRAASSHNLCVRVDLFGLQLDVPAVQPLRRKITEQRGLTVGHQQLHRATRPNPMLRDGGNHVL
eukprot:2832553-Lingulodinium_polyedra.AAC.1